MLNFIYSPKWFIGKDLLIDGFSFITLLLIAFITYQYYRIDNSKKLYLLISGAFLILSGSFFFKIITYFTLYFYQLYHLNQLPVISTIKSYNIAGLRFSHLGFIILMATYRLFHLAGLYLLYLVYKRKINIIDVLMMFYAIFMITYFSQNKYFVFHLSTLFLLSIMAYLYYEKFIHNRNRRTFALSITFGVIALSQLFFIFEINPYFYVFGELIQLLGYGMFLGIFLIILKNGKKTK